jgi:protein-S-isoprenylcysteine O-methyltransferase Ste14
MRVRAAAIAAFGVVAYAAFLASIAVVLASFAPVRLPLPFVTPVDERPAPAPGAALAIDLGLLLAFGVHHSAMARPACKRVLTKLVPASSERSVYVLFASLLLGTAAYAWRPLPGTLVRATSTAGQALALALFGGGVVIMTTATFLQDHAELFGLRQSVGALRAPRFRVPSLYRIVRHPMTFGVLLALWATPVLTSAHALFAGGMTAYALVGLRFEERDLLRTFGAEYERYRRQVPMLLPWPRRRRR